MESARLLCVCQPDWAGQVQLWLGCFLWTWLAQIAVRRQKAVETTTLNDFGFPVRNLRTVGMMLHRCMEHIQGFVRMSCDLPT